MGGHEKPEKKTPKQKKSNDSVAESWASSHTLQSHVDYL